MALKAGSLVSSIVQKAGTYDQNVIDECIERLGKRSAHLKGEIYEVVKEHYVEFESYVSTTVSLEQRVQAVRLEYQKLATQIEQELNSKISQSLIKREESESKLVEIRSRIALIQDLVDVYHALEESKLDVQSVKYVSAAQRLSKVAELMSDVAKTGCEAKVFSALKSEHAQVTSDLTICLKEKWQGLVSWTPKVLSAEPNLNALGTVELHVPMYSPSQEQQRCEVIAAMKLLTSAGVWEQCVSQFTGKLLQRVIKPLIVHASLKVTQLANKSERVLCVKKVPEDANTTLPQLYDMLVSVFTLIGHIVPEEHKKEWLSMIGATLCPEVQELLIAHRLSTSIPRSSAELEQYETIREKTKAFEAALFNIGVGKVVKLSEYADNVNVHFVSQKNQDMLVKARTILLQPIHDTVIVGRVEPFTKLQEILPTSTTPHEQEGEFDLGTLNFSFPRCAVSRSVQEFVELLYKTLRECVATSDPSAGVQLFNLARNMVNLFCAVLFSYHNRAVSDLPRAAAVQHNNCMYLAHHLMTLGHQFYSRLPAPLNAQTSTFVDQVPLVRSLGEECFLAEMKKQSACLLEFLKSIGSFNEVSSDLHRELARQCLQRASLHLSKLSKVYLEVLPVTLHHKSVGALMNVLLSEIVAMVVSMQDIAVDDATELHAILCNLMDKIPSALLLTAEETASESVETYCKAWGKVKALAAVLNGSLPDIVELWDSGKGSLAREFSVSETRGLIKALFRNTERRAAALNKITS